jgi:outer membrane protein OmpA-like peptidoglycan-associated protein
MRFVLFLLPCVVALCSCDSPPKPPSADESTRRPANTSVSIDLQVCTSELHNTRIAAAESRRAAEATVASLERAAARQRLQTATQATLGANMVFTMHFDFGSVEVNVPSEEGETLLKAARTSPLLVLRGRTDGTRDSAAESRIARSRAEAVRDYLVDHGIDPHRIRTTYQPSGDFAVDNDSQRGRAMNRRVEIELYRALPAVADESTTTLP